MEGTGYGLPQILLVTIPAAIVACIATSFVQQRLGKDLLDDPEFLKRVKNGTVEVPAALRTRYEAKFGGGASVSAGAPTAVADEAGTATSSVTPSRAAAKTDKVALIEHPVPEGGKTAAWIFMAGTFLVVLLGLFPGLRPAFPDDEGELVPIGMSIVIEMVMFSAALVIILVRKVKPSLVVEQPLLRAGFVAAVALFGIAWMADTFISANEETIIEPLGALIEAQPLWLAVALFIVCGLTTSQSATTNTLIPIALVAGLAPGIITAMWPSLIGVWLFPANGSQIASVETDMTGSTKLTQVPVWHSFTVPMLVSWVAVVATGLLIQLVIPA